MYQGLVTAQDRPAADTADHFTLWAVFYGVTAGLICSIFLTPLLGVPLGILIGLNCHKAMKLNKAMQSTPHVDADFKTASPPPK